ncbi:hypothetical protein GGI35DRAFT_473897 [Trichoderma velutinum]
MHLSSILLIATNVGLALSGTLPFTQLEKRSPTEYHYLTASGKEVRTSNISEPIRINGIPVSTTFLAEEAAEGTKHHISSGHHFYQPNWIISSDANGLHWVYNSTMRARVNKFKASRGSFNKWASDKLQYEYSQTRDAPQLVN